MTDQEHVTHQMVNGRCPVCVAASGGQAHIVLTGDGGYVIGGGGGGGFSPEVTEDRRPYVELAEGGASQGGASYVGGGVRADGGGVTGGNRKVRHPMPVNVTCRGGGGGNVGDPVEITVTDKRMSETADSETIQLAVQILLDNGQDDGAHHKMWAIDQALRALTGTRYEDVIAEYRAGEDGPNTYSWDEGGTP